MSRFLVQRYIAELEKVNTYRFADYKDKVIDLLKRVTTVSVRTVEIMGEMEATDLIYSV